MTTLPVYDYSIPRGRPDLRVLLPAVILPCIAVLAALLAVVLVMRYRRRSRFIELEDVPYTPTTAYSPSREWPVCVTHQTLTLTNGLVLQVSVPSQK